MPTVLTPQTKTALIRCDVLIILILAMPCHASKKGLLQQILSSPTNPQLCKPENNWHSPLPKPTTTKPLGPWGPVGLKPSQLSTKRKHDRLDRFVFVDSGSPASSHPSCHPSFVLSPSEVGPDQRNPRSSMQPRSLSAPPRLHCIKASSSLLA